MTAADWSTKSDGDLHYWHRFHTSRIAHDTAHADDVRADPNDLLTDERRAGLIEQCELTIHHSRRYLGEIQAEAARRGLELEEA